MKQRLVIVGCGRLGTIVAEAVATGLLPEYELVGCYSRTFDKTERLVAKMAEAGIACNVHYKPLPLHTAYRELGFDMADFPNAYAHFANEITLPLHTRLTDGEIGYILEKFTQIIGEYIA